MTSIPCVVALQKPKSVVAKELSFTVHGSSITCPSLPPPKGSKAKKAPPSTFAFDRVYSPEAIASPHHGDLYKNDIAPLVSKFLTGYNCSLLLFGEANSGKKSLLFGTQQGASSSSTPNDSYYESLLHMTLVDTFSAIEKSKIKNAPTPQLIIQFCAFNNLEKGILDLLNESEDHAVIPLTIEVSPNCGNFVRGLTQLTSTDLKDCSSKIIKGVGKYCTAVLQDPPVKNSSLYLSLTLLSSEVSATLSMFVISGFEDLSPPNPRSLGLSNFITYVKNLANHEETGNEREASLVSILRESLEGNSHTLSIVTGHPFTTISIAAIFDLVITIKRLKTSPVLRSPEVCALEGQFFRRIKEERKISFYRGQRLSTQGPLRDGTNPSMPPLSSSSSIHNNEPPQAIVELQKNLDKMREDNEKLVSALLKLRNKYNAMVGEKNDLGMKLAKETEELRKATGEITELRLEKTRLLSEHAQKQSDQTAMIVRLERELKGNATSHNGLTLQLQEKMKQLEQENEDLTNEYISLKTNYLSINQKYNDTMKQNKEMTAELLQILRNTQKPQDDNQKTLQRRMSSIVETMHNNSVPSNPPPLVKNPDNQKEKGSKLKNAEDSKSISSKTGPLTSVRQIDEETLTKIKLLEAKVADLTIGMNAARHRVVASERANVDLRTSHEQFVQEYRERLHRCVEQVSEFLMKQAALPGPSVHNTDIVKSHLESFFQELKRTYVENESELSAFLVQLQNRLKEETMKSDEIERAYELLRDEAEKKGVVAPPLLVPLVTAPLDENKMKEKLEQIQKGGLSQDEFLSEAKRALRDFTVATQAGLEKERSELMAQCSFLQEKNAKLESYIATNIGSLQKEIARLTSILAKQNM